MPTPVCWYSHCAVTDRRLEPARRPRSQSSVPSNPCCAAVRRLPLSVHSSIERAAMLMNVSEPSWAASKTTVVALWKVSASGSSLSDQRDLVREVGQQCGAGAGVRSR